MKQSIRLLSLLLSIAMVFSMLACDNNEPTTTTETTVTTEPVETTEATIASEPSAADIYNAAKAKLDSATDISLSVNSTTYITVADSQFSEQTDSTLTYRGIGTENTMILSEDAITYGIHLETDEKDDKKASPTKYTEIWSGGNVYAQLDGTHHTTSAMDAETAKARYTPVSLLDASLYGTVTQEAADGGIRILFSDATAGESWIVPEGARLQEASGTALISAEGDLTEMTYAVTFTLGSAQYKTECSAKPMDEVKEITVPTNTDHYLVTEQANALYLYATAISRLAQAERYSVNNSSSIFSYAGALSVAAFADTAVHEIGEELMFKIDETTHYTDYQEQISDSITHEITYCDGKLTMVTNDGLPSSKVTPADQLRDTLPRTEYMDELSPQYWEEVTATQFGNLYLLEFKLNEEFGNNQHNTLSDTLFGSATALYDIATEYKNGELTGYLSIDLYTGIPVSVGYKYEGFHTIEGDECELSCQVDNAIMLPDISAYKTISDKMPEEAEPETKPTPVFYKVTGDKGQEMWLLGTIHVGDERTAYLPQEIKDAFAASDALAIECDTKAFEQQLDEDEELAEKVSNMYYYSGEDTLKTKLSEEEYAEVIQLLKATGNYNMNSDYLKAGITAETINNTYLALGYQLTRDQGVEERLYQWAEEQDKEIREVESCMFQTEMSTGWSDDIQYVLLGSVTDTPEEYWTEAYELYEQWCAGDEAILRESMAQDVNMDDWTEEEKAEYEEYKPHLDEYNKTMEHDRNEGMLQKAIEYLESGDVVFYAVGLAHLLGDTNGLVDTLREAGYTVEQVTYAQ